jgi:hypothetical protein
MEIYFEAVTYPNRFHPHQRFSIISEACCITSWTRKSRPKLLSADDCVVVAARNRKQKVTLVTLNLKPAGTPITDHANFAYKHQEKHKLQGSISA